MTEHNLREWLLEEGIAEELAHLTRMTVVTEISNLRPDEEARAILPNLDWERLMLAGSILARSSARSCQEAVLRIATAALTLDVGQPVRDAAAILLDKVANHRSIGLAEARARLSPGLASRLGMTQRLEAQRRKIENSVMLESTGERLSVNDFQRKFWEGASSKLSWTSASAPTASGKTFLVLQWLIDRVRVNEARIVVYLAPTRALVAEIEDSLNHMLKAGSIDGIEVSSLPLRQKYEEATSGARSLVLVFTQERMHLLANLLDDKIAVDLLVVDEAHKIGDHQRGVVLQDAIERLSRANSALRVVFISPATQNPGDLLDDAPAGIDAVEIDSDAPTVLQNLVVATQVPRKPKEWQLHLRQNHGDLRLGILDLGSKPAGLRKRLAFIAAAAGSRGGTLVYTNGAAEAEDVAFLISQFVEPTGETDQDLAALADLARKGVHRNYQLAPLVERGVAFHYGNMPSLIRTEIERLFRLGKIRFLVCTSTLIEGVNLSCRTIVVRGPRKGRGKPMEPHDFWNLAGRAGRWGDEFQGNIICIDPEDTDAWPTGVPKRARYPIQRETDAILKDGTRLLGFLSERATADEKELFDEPQLEQVGAYLLTTFMRLGSVVEATFAKRHDANELAAINEQLGLLAAKIEVPMTMAVRHPGVSAVGLQKLLHSLRAHEGDVEDLLLAPPESVDAYERLVFAFERVNADLYPAFQPAGLIPLHAQIVLEWLRGLSLSSIIKKRIEFQQRRGTAYKLPSLIRETMELVEQIARFRAPKYLAAYIDVINLHLRQIKREDLIENDLDIGVALEFGVSSQTLLALMELGLSRMSAVALYEKIVRDNLDRTGCLAWFVEHDRELDGMDIPVLIIREVRDKLGGLVAADSTDQYSAD
ncbi:DEAD/DEAH box helicase (plasmid) [Rhizobium leguminosarum bv. viciae 248]|uniref:DEAD/DEAH box helicase n=1 Tax=Rhizobium leguminosarum TaxID=384 RepID=UPI0004769D50|nr:DEAD/DEAH box helicase [Rhizobium leguminosarum]QHW29196.1 DEAD/DEAH box helicase [Rhizobium leguminosarum bv. viciae 248]